jgi:hypothetical protein
MRNMNAFLVGHSGSDSSLTLKIAVLAALRDSRRLFISLDLYREIGSEKYILDARDCSASHPSAAVPVYACV